MVNENKLDLAVAITKGIVAVLPIVGPLTSELISYKIPSQRLKRIEDLLKKLEQKVQNFEKTEIDNAFNKIEFIDLYEEAIYQASRAISEERRDQIASIIKNSISDNTEKIIQYKHILSLLNQLNDVEIIILRAYDYNYLGENSDFWKKHKNILEPEIATNKSDQNELDKYFIHESYKEHLDRLGLFSKKFNQLKMDRMSEFDLKTGAPKFSGFKLTNLGRILLKAIDEKISE